MGEVLKTFQSKGGRPAETRDADGPSLSQKSAGSAAGLSERQIKDAVRVANVPAEAFERAGEKR